jgi:GAF domain-containing protein
VVAVDEQTGAADVLMAAMASIQAPVGVEASVQAIAEAALDALPGINHVGVSMAHRNGRMETLAATDELVRRLDRLQYETGEGPCVYAMRGHRVVEVPHLELEERWPQFVPGAVALGLRAQIGVQLFSDRETFGALNLYSTEQSSFAPGTAHLAELFATHAAFVLGRSRREDQLTTAIESRKVIGQAIGIVMERYGLDEQRAFAFLVRASSTANTKLRQVAQDLVATANRRGRPA